MDTNENKKKAKKALAIPSDFILVSYSKDSGVGIQSSIGAYAFTMLGAIELAKEQLVAGFRERAELEQNLAP